MLFIHTNIIDKNARPIYVRCKRQRICVCVCLWWCEREIECRRSTKKMALNSQVIERVRSFFSTKYFFFFLFLNLFFSLFQYSTFFFPEFFCFALFLIDCFNSRYFTVTVQLSCGLFLFSKI